jgi:hypothetical protein
MWIQVANRIVANWAHTKENIAGSRASTLEYFLITRGGISGA